jgi:hypothetical protein
MASTTIEPGMKVAVRRNSREYIGVVIRLEADQVVVHLTQTEGNEPPEFTAHPDDVRPLEGWI